MLRVRVIKFWFVLAVLALLALSACSGAAAPAEKIAMQSDSAMSGAPMAPAVYASDLPTANPERIVIKNASMTIVVEDPSLSVDKIGQMAEEMGGFVVSADLNQSETYSGQQVPRGMIVIRVPAERLNEALDTISSESNQKPIRQNLTSQDVTSDYVDLQSRLRNEQAAEAQLLQFMEQTTRTEDALNVHSQLTQVRERIEVLQGQIKYYDESAALSSITTELLVDEAVQPVTIGQWELGSVAKSALKALLNTLKFLGNTLIWIAIYILPVVLVLFLVFALPVILIVRYVRRRRNKSAATSQAAPVEKAEG